MKIDLDYVVLGILKGKNEWSVWSETSKYRGLRPIIGKLASKREL